MNKRTLQNAQAPKVQHQRAKRYQSQAALSIGQTNARLPWAIAVAMSVMVLGALFIVAGATSPIEPGPARSTVTRVTTNKAMTEAPSDIQISNSQVHAAPDIAIISQAALTATHIKDGTGAAFKIASPSLKPTGRTVPAVRKASKSQTQTALAEDTFLPSLKPSKRKTKGQAIKVANIGASYDPLITHPLNLRRMENINALPTHVSFFSLEETRRLDTLDNPASILAALDRDIVALPVTKTFALRRGETFVDLLERAGVSREDRNYAAAAISKSLNLRALPAGFTFNITTTRPNQTYHQEMVSDNRGDIQLISMSANDRDNNRIELSRTAESTFTARKTARPVTTRLQAISGVIEGNLYLSMRKQGAPDNVINALANVFAFDIDFQREIFGGDRFEAIYEVRYDDQGEMIDGGQILFGKLSWRGNRREKGYYYFDPASQTQRADYYDEDGKSARRLLMKTPIDGARLSSSFGPRRHPILGYRKTHKGVDFAARRGTPIKATGDGVIERANRYGSYGNYIRIRHSNGYKTAYAHLKGFARGMRSGKRVRQGDIIGYVGTTGRSTGPHLHYEVHYKGKAVNPQKLKISTGVTLSGKARNTFVDLRDRIDALRTAPEETSRYAGSSGSSSAH